jgi:hypothetical protein
MLIILDFIMFSLLWGLITLPLTVISFHITVYIITIIEKIWLTIIK